MAVDNLAVTVTGLTELRAALKEVGPEFVKELKIANKEAGDMVVQRGQATARGVGGAAHHAAPSLKASARANGVFVILGGNGHPEAMGAEFGSFKYKQFKPWRGNGADAGYFLWPTIRAVAADGTLVDKYAQMLDRVTSHAFPD